MKLCVIITLSVSALLGQFTQVPSPTGGGVGAAAFAPAYSATPTFNLAAANRWEPGLMTGNVTSVTFTNKVAGMRFSVVWTQDGTGGRTVAYGASASGTCSVSSTASVATTQQFEIASDGTTVLGVGCTSTDAATLISGPTRSAPPPPTSGLSCWFDSTLNTQACIDPASVVTVMAPGCRKLTVTTSGGYWTVNAIQNAALAASVTQTITVATNLIPASGSIVELRIKHSTAFSGTAIAGMSVSLGDGTTTNVYAPDFNVFQAVANTTLWTDFGAGATTAAQHSLTATFTSTGANLSAISAGVVVIHACVRQLP